MTDDVQLNEAKAWHQKWWGMVFLVILVLPLIYAAAFIYQVVFFVEQKTTMAQSLLQNSNSVYQANLPTLALKPTIETEDDPYIGAATAKIVIVEFADFECPYCFDSYPTVRRLAVDYPNDVKIIFRDFPNTAIHPDALNAAMAASCAFDQGKFWEYHDWLYENQGNLSLENLKLLATDAGLDATVFNQCLDSQKYLNEAKNDLQDGIQLGITGTPTFFINGFEIQGSFPYENFKQIIDQYLSLQNSNTNGSILENQNINSQ
ncbi:MAG: DsbA family protein [Candidatus Parcubacteria bacterium]|nr:DsbA family protein [Candidatus Parcubacteria bacterium]